MQMPEGLGRAEAHVPDLLIPAETDGECFVTLHATQLDGTGRAYFRPFVRRENDFMSLSFSEGVFSSHDIGHDRTIGVGTMHEILPLTAGHTYRIGVQLDSLGGTHPSLVGFVVSWTCKFAE